MPLTGESDCKPYWCYIFISCKLRYGETGIEMGLFSKKVPQQAFDALGFTITDTLLDPPRFTFLPAIYQDADHAKWAVKYRGADPSVFDYADIVQCEVAESGSAEEASKVSNQEMAHQIIANPSKAARINAAKRNMCLGMGVVVAVRTAEGEIAKLQIPVMTDEVKRDSALYRSYRAVAEELAGRFEAMRQQAQA